MIHFSFRDHGNDPLKTSILISKIRYYYKLF